MLVSRTVRREDTHLAAILHTGIGDCHFVWYTGCSGVISVGICAHAVLDIRPLYVGMFEVVFWTNVWSSAFSSRDHTTGRQYMVHMNHTDRVERYYGVSRHSQRKVLSQPLLFEPCKTLCFVHSVHNAHLRFILYIRRFNIWT